MNLPLYSEFQLQKAEANPGLLFDKFADGWSPGWNKKLENDVKKRFFNQFAEADYGYLQSSLDSYLQRQENLVCKLCGPDTSPLLFLRTDWRFVTGLGSQHPYETGFIWHRTLGVPYLPGSSIKGLLRAWLEQWCDMDEESRKTMQLLFGFGSGEGAAAKDEAGTLIVFDALPVRVPELELDILNPHYQPYYENREKPPADYYSPVPVFFLTVAPRQTFRFCLAPRPGADSDNPDLDIKEGLTLLQDALENIGAGGKTAVGYGVMVSPGKQAAHWLESILEELRNNRDFRGQPEENLWKKALAKKWISAPGDLKPFIRDLIKKKWISLGLNWNNPVGGSAKQAKIIFSRH